MTLKKSDLVNNFESFKAPSDPAVTMSYDSIQKNVALNVHFDSTELPPSTGSDLLFNRSEFVMNKSQIEQIK